LRFQNSLIMTRSTGKRTSDGTRRRQGAINDTRHLGLARGGNP
jgi:hypothetical protein